MAVETVSTSPSSTKGFRNGQFGVTYIHSLPTELLAHIFAQLSPATLNQAALVCKSWHDVISDEASWRTAFETYYGVLGDGTSTHGPLESKPAGLALGRRLHPHSWRSEYIARVKLLHRWQKSRTPSVTYNTNVGPLQDVHISFPSVAPGPSPSIGSASRISSPNSNRSNSTAIGVVHALSHPSIGALCSASNPSTGRVSKHVLAPWPPMPAGVFFDPPPATATTLSSDGSRVIWGMEDGSLRSALVPVLASAGRVGTDRERSEVRAIDGHRGNGFVKMVAAGTPSFGTSTSTANANTLGKQGTSFFSSSAVPAEQQFPVTTTGPVSATVSSASPRFDIAVYLISEAGSNSPAPRLQMLGAEREPFARKVWSYSSSLTPSSLLPVATSYVGQPTAMSFHTPAEHPASASLALGFEGGQVVMWLGSALLGGGSAATDADQDDARPAARAVVIDSFLASTAVDTLIFDTAPSSTVVKLLVHHASSPDFYRVTIPLNATSSPSWTRFAASNKNDSSLNSAPLTAFAHDFASVVSSPRPASQDKLAGNLSRSSGSGTGSGRRKPQTVTGRITSFTAHSSPANSIPGTPVLEKSLVQAVDDPSGSTRDRQEMTILDASGHLTAQTMAGSSDSSVSVVAAFGQAPFIAAGDSRGRVYLWDWSLPTMSAQEDSQGSSTSAPADRPVILPRRCVAGAPEFKVTALEVTEATVLVGSLDGTLRIYDLLTTSLLRTFKDRSAPRLPARMLATGQLGSLGDEQRWSVSHVRATRDAVVAAVGGKIVSWRVDDRLGAIQGGKRRGGAHGILGPGGGSSLQGRMSARTERFRSDLELRQEVRDSLDSLSAESTDRIARLGQDQRLAHEFGLPPSLDNMTEDEAVALALMLSADDYEEQQWLAEAGAQMQVQQDRDEDEYRSQDEDEVDLEGLSLDDQSSSHRAFGNRRVSPMPHFENDYEGEAECTRDQDRERGGNGTVREESSPSTTMGYRQRYGASPQSPSSLSVPTSPTTITSGWRGLGSSSTSSHAGSPRASSSGLHSYQPTWRPPGSPSLVAADHRNGGGAGLNSGSYAPSSWSSSSREHHKIQVSPRLGPTYGSASPRHGATSPRAAPDGGVFGYVPAGPVPDMSEELWPTAAEAVTPVRGIGSNLSPSPSPASPSSRSSPGPSPNLVATSKPGSSQSPAPPKQNGWSEIVARSGDASPSAPSASPSVSQTSSAASAWSKPSSTPSSPHSSLLTAQLRATGTATAGTAHSSASSDEAAAIRASRETELRRREEEELRFAIELSRAEEESRTLALAQAQAQAQDQAH